MCLRMCSHGEQARKIECERARQCVRSNVQAKEVILRSWTALNTFCVCVHIYIAWELCTHSRCVLCKKDMRHEHAYSMTCGMRHMQQVHASVS